ncbi:MAG: nucleoside phosphorylase [Acidimicrobiales bacterium]
MTESLGFPRFPGKHQGDALITAKNVMEAIGASDRSVPSSIALGYSPTQLPPLLAERGFVEIFGYPPPWFSIWRREGIDLGFVAGFGIGAPAAAMVLEELVELGATRFVSLGFAGALSNELDFEDVVVCSKALRDEGVSHHYLAPARYSFPSETLSAHLLRALAGDGEAVSVGPTWTIDAIYRETMAEATAYRDEGILTVDMEAAALFAVGEVLGVDVASVFTISDHLLAHDEWKLAPGRKRGEGGLGRLVDAAIAALT